MISRRFYYIFFIPFFKRNFKILPIVFIFLINFDFQYVSSPFSRIRIVLLLTAAKSTASRRCKWRHYHYEVAAVDYYFIFKNITKCPSERFCETHVIPGQLAKKMDSKPSVTAGWSFTPIAMETVGRVAANLNTCCKNWSLNSDSMKNKFIVHFVLLHTSPHPRKNLHVI